MKFVEFRKLTSNGIATSMSTTTMFHVVLIVLTTFDLMISLSRAEETTASFSGESYIYYKLDKKVDTNRDKVTLMFKTTEAFGVLMYSCGRRQGDFLMLELKRGKLVYTGNFGSMYQQSGIHSLASNKQYNDNKWHRVSLSRENGTLVYLTVEVEKKSHKSPSEFEQLNIEDLYIGGVGENERNDTSCYPAIKTTVNFIGCLANLHFNSMYLLYGAKEKFSDKFKTFGKELTYSCIEKKEDVFGFHTIHSQLIVQRQILHTNELSFGIEFRTFEPNGHIATHKCVEGEIEMRLISGKLQVVISFLGITAPTAVIIDSETNLNNGDWHYTELKVQRKEERVILKVDKKTSIRILKGYLASGSSYGIGKFMGSITFGGNSQEIPGLLSCFRKLKVDNEIITFDSVKIKENDGVINFCKIKDLCFPNPCKRGVCSQELERYTCKCDGTDYTGPRCEQCKYKKTCDELKRGGIIKNGYYKLCSKNERVFTAYCDMATGETVIEHKLHNRTKINAVQIDYNSNTYFHNVEYVSKPENILDLLTVSTSCKQYIRFDCFKSKLLNRFHGKPYEDYVGVRWVSRESEPQEYWGGSNAERKACRCGMDGSCAEGLDGKKECNCDVADARWRYDDGFLTEKSVLPVTQIQVYAEKDMNTLSRFSLGYLRCSGTIYIPTEPPKTLELTSTLEVLYSVMTTMNSSNNISIVKPPIISSVTKINIDSLFSKPWLITIVCIGVVLCLLLVFLMFVLYRQHVGDLFYKCMYGRHNAKPVIEIEDYNRYSTATENQSDWDIHNLSTTFPTSTPAPSYGPTDDEQSTIDMRCRTLEDVRTKKQRLKGLNTWGSHTASAPTVMGSLGSLQYTNENVESEKKIENEIKLSDSKSRFGSSDTAFSTTATDGEADSVMESEYSETSNKSSLKESEHSLEKLNKEKRYNDVKKPSAEKSKRILNNYFHIPRLMHHTQTVYNDQLKTYVPVMPLPINSRNHHQPVMYAHPMDPHVQYATRCQLTNQPSKHRAAMLSETYKKHNQHPTIEEKCEDTTDSEHDEVLCYYDNPRNSDGFYDGNQPDQEASPSSETRLLFDDDDMRDEQERQADEQIKLLKKKVIKKATSIDECF